LSLSLYQDRHDISYIMWPINLINILIKVNYSNISMDDNFDYKIKPLGVKNETNSLTVGTKKGTLRNDFFTPKKFLILYSRIIFDGNYKKATEWLEEQGFKVSKATYYRTIMNGEEEAFESLAHIGKNYYQIVENMRVKLQGFEREMINELQKKKPNPVKINGYLQLMRIQPLLSAFDKQVKRLIEQSGTTNEHLTV